MLRIQIKYIKIAVPLLIILFVLLIPNMSVFQNASKDLSIGILLDLLVTIPILYYIAIRKTQVPKFTIIYPIILGMIIAHYIIPSENQYILSSIKMIVIPAIEISVITMIWFKISSLNTSLKNITGDDFYDKLLQACQEVFPNRIGKIMATEFAVAYYLFAPRKKKTHGDLEFTYFKKSGIRTIIGVFLFLVSIETFVLHLLVSKWESTIAWIVSFLGVYTIIQIIAILKSMNSRLISLNPEKKILNLRYGFGTQTSIPFDSIKKIEKNRKTISDDENHISLSLFDLLDSTNITIHLNTKNSLLKIYGIEKDYTSISLFVDEMDTFVAKINEIIIQE